MICFIGIVILIVVLFIWWVMSSWLVDFVYWVNVSFFIFIIGGVVLLIIVLFMVSG